MERSEAKELLLISLPAYVPHYIDAKRSSNSGITTEAVETTCAETLAVAATATARVR